MFSLGTELKASFWAAVVFFVDLTNLVGRVIWLQLFQVTFFKEKKPSATSKSQMKQRRLKTKDRLGQVEIFVFSVFFFAAIMSCDAGGEDHSKNWSVKRQRNSCFWLESCEKPGFLEDPAHRVLFLGHEHFGQTSCLLFFARFSPNLLAWRRYGVNHDKWIIHYQQVVRISF